MDIDETKSQVENRRQVQTNGDDSKQSDQTKQNRARFGGDTKILYSPAPGVLICFSLFLDFDLNGRKIKNYESNEMVSTLQHTHSHNILISDTHIPTLDSTKTQSRPVQLVNLTDRFLSSSRTFRSACLLHCPLCLNYFTKTRLDGGKNTDKDGQSNIFPHLFVPNLAQIHFQNTTRL